MLTIRSNPKLASLTLCFCVLAAASLLTSAYVESVQGQQTPEPPPQASESRPQAPKDLVDSNDARTKPKEKSKTSDEKELRVIRIKIDPPSVSFDLTDHSRSETKPIVINDEDVSDEWTFVRFKEWDKRIGLRVNSTRPNGQTLDRGAWVVPDQWFGFKNRIALDLILSGDGLDKPEVVTLELEKGSAQLPEDSIKAASDAVRDKKIAPNASGKNILNVSWTPAQTIDRMKDEWTLLERVLAWFLGSAVVILIVSVMLKLTVLEKIMPRKKPKRGPGSPKSQPKYQDKIVTMTREGVPPSVPEEKSALPAETGVGKLDTETLQKLTGSLGRQEDLITSLKTQVTPEIAALRTSIDSLLPKNLKAELEPLIREITNNANSKFESLETQFAALKQTVENEEKLLRGKQEELGEKQEELAKTRHQADLAIHQQNEEQRLIRTSLSKIQQLVEEKKEPDITYARMLGALLGNNVDALEEDNFQQLGEAVNRFFREEIPQPSERLDDLKQRVDGINSAVETLLVKARDSSKDAAAELVRPAGRVRQVSEELNSLYFQIHSRQSYLLLPNLRIPVAIHASARDGFLEELGFALKGEIEKLRNPEAYFERQLKQLAASELVAIVDICDGKMQTQPGANDELENVLNTLFAHAGLDPILPRLNDEYQSSMQECGDTVDSPGPAMNRKVARIVSRGFHYEKDLLRKARVDIYG